MAGKSLGRAAELQAIKISVNYSLPTHSSAEMHSFVFHT